MVAEMLRDPAILTVIATSIVAAVIAINVMARESSRGALRWTRAVMIVLLATAVIVLASSAVVLHSGSYHFGHSANSLSGFIFMVVLHMLIPLPAWLVIGTAAVIVLGMRSSQIARANGTPT